MPYLFFTINREYRIDRIDVETQIEWGVSVRLGCSYHYTPKWSHFGTNIPALKNSQSMILITRNAKIQWFFPCILTKSVLLVDVCRLPIAWSVEIIFHAFHGLFFQESKTFWPFPSFQNDYTIQKKPGPTTPTEHTSACAGFGPAKIEAC